MSNMKQETVVETIVSEPEKELRLWNKNSILLWQGLLVSAVGSVVYEIALGFWVLAVTGSTALMGTLMAASAAPRIILSPFAGVLVDRSDRRWILVIMDFIRGVAVVGVAIAAYAGTIEIWMVFAAGVVIGVCGAFFQPAVGSAIPDLVPKTKIVQANSFFGMIHSFSGIIGNSAGGFLYALLGAPLMFLVNGISYIFSAVTELFISIPRIPARAVKVTFWDDLKSGLRFAWDIAGLRFLLIAAAILNFFAIIGVVLLLPLFEKYAHLGPEKYGIMMGLFTGGLVAGMSVTSSLNIQPDKRFFLLAVSAIVNSVAMSLLPLYLNILYMSALVFVAGFGNAIINVFISATIQLTVPQDMRGKVFGLIGTIAGGLTPVAMALGGLLAEFIPVRVVIFSGFAITGISFIPLLLQKPFRDFINFNPETQSMEDLIKS
ncbi:MAG: MFS transporter [candidate division Zixibacteria bacterium]|nr:MFS transporter [candidate division Zixibacteria bacterium]